MSAEITGTDQGTGPTHVVSAFLLSYVDGQDRVLLVRRSQRVRTYKGAWGTISGYLEPGVTPLDQAYTELREEAGLERDAVRLLAQGAPLRVTDREAGLDWVVHPFLFALDDPERIHTDWEAEQFEWVAPATLMERTTVPMLAEALDEVYPPRETGGQT